MLDERQTQARSAKRAAAGDIHAIETLGETRKMLGGNAGAVIAHGGHRLGLASHSGG